MEAIHILARIDAAQHLLRTLRKRLWQRQLHENAVHFLICVELVDTGKQFLPRSLSGQRDMMGSYSQLRAGLLLVADIDLRGRIVAHDDNGKARMDAALTQHKRPMLRACLDAHSKLLAIQYACHDALLF